MNEWPTAAIEYMMDVSRGSLNTLNELTNDDSLPMIAVLPSISNGASYRLCGKIYGYSA